MPNTISKIKPPVPESDKRYEKESIEYTLSALLIDLVNKRSNVYSRYMDNPEHVELLIQKHAYYFDRLLNKDGKDINELMSVFEWSQQNDFWRQNIKSSYKLREKYDTILDQMTEDFKYDVSIADEFPLVTEKFIKVFRALISNPSYKPSVKEQNKFIAAARRATEFYVPRNIHPDYWPEYLMRCLEKNFLNSGLTIYPGNFNSDHTWNILMPQYLQEIGL